VPQKTKACCTESSMDYCILMIKIFGFVVLSLALIVNIGSNQTKGTAEEKIEQQQQLLTYSQILALIASIVFTISDWMNVFNHNHISTRETETTVLLTEKKATSPITKFSKPCCAQMSWNKMSNLAFGNFLIANNILAAQNFHQHQTPITPSTHFLLKLITLSGGINIAAGIPCVIKYLRTSGCYKAIIGLSALGGFVATALSLSDGNGTDSKSMQFFLGMLYFASTAAPKLLNSTVRHTTTPSLA
jgi:hypothetical protein